MRRLLPAFLAALACAACTAPIFDPSMSLAARTLDRIPVFSVTDPLKSPVDGSNNPRFDLRSDAITFLPERIPGSFDISKGFVIRTYHGTSEIWYEWFNGSEVQWMKGPWSFSTEGTMPSRLAVGLKIGPYLGAIEFEDSQAYADRLWANIAIPELTFNPPQHSPPAQADKIFSDIPAIGSPPLVVGISVNGDVLPAQDRINALVRIGNQFSEASTLVSQAGVGAWGPVMGINYPLGFLLTPWHLNYYRDFNYGRSFAQSYDGTAWTTWVWWGILPTENAPLAAVTHRIDAVLSLDAGPGASHLFSTEDQMGRVYRYDGSVAMLVAEFALGTLRFIGEANVGGVWKMLFSRCVVDYQNEQLEFEIRALDTAALLSTFAP